MIETPVKISVILISFNGREFIEDCLDTTINSLEGESYEIIIVDNGSKDGSVEIFKEKYTQAVLIANSDNLGFAPAVNQGLKAAKGEYLLLLNQDTKIIDRAIVKLAEKMSSDDNIGSIGPKFVGFDGKLQFSARAFPKYRDLLWHFTGLSSLFPGSQSFNRWKMGWFDHETEMAVDQPMGAALMVSRRTIEKVGYFDESFRIFFNDVDYCRRIIMIGLKNLYYPEAVVAHFVGGSTRKNRSKMIIESHRAMYQYFKKYNHSVWSLPCLWFWGLILRGTAFIRAALSK